MLLLVMLVVAWWSTRVVLLGFIVGSGYLTVWPSGAAASASPPDLNSMAAEGPAM